ncbi:MAG: peptide chain release factor 1 [Chloroflexi bacterium]|nr:peptide chain release factor 1 [Chloroflexota bacterium]
MYQRLDAVVRRYDELTAELAEAANDYERLIRLTKERGELEPLVELYREYRKVEADLTEARQLLATESDPELLAMAKEEVHRLEPRLEQLDEQLKLALLPKDPNDEKDVFVEIRAGVGGEEAALFAADLFRMYSRYAERKGWDVEVLDTTETGLDGFQKIIFRVAGRGAYSRLKYESGVHRVQRVPVTEASGRIHTSAATVAVLPEADEIEVQINPEDLEIDVFRSQGHGGQSVNTTDSAVRITHKPTGIVVTCQDERSQLKNKARALAVLRARLYDLEQSKRQSELTETRRSMVRSGDRSEKIRTYNFPQDRVTDHRINLTLYRLPAIMDGDLDPLIDALVAADQAERLAAAQA